MKGMVSTIIVFGFIFIIILGGAFLFQKMHGLDTIKNADQKINEDLLHRVIDAKPDAAENGTKENAVDDTQPARTEEPAPADDSLEIMPSDNVSPERGVHTL